MGFVKVAEAEKVAIGTGTVVEAGGKELALFNVDGEFFCIDNSCPHRDGPLGEGELHGDAVMCPYHAWQFSVRTGEGLYGCGVGVRTYECKVEDGAVLVDASKPTGVRDRSLSSKRAAKHYLIPVPFR